MGFQDSWHRHQDHISNGSENKPSQSIFHSRSHYLPKLPHFSMPSPEDRPYQPDWAWLIQRPAKVFWMSPSLRLVLFEKLAIGVFVEVARWVGRMYLIHKIYRTVGSTKLIFGIHKDQPTSVGYLRAAFKKNQNITLHNGIVFGTYKSLGYY